MNDAQPRVERKTITARMATTRRTTTTERLSQIFEGCRLGLENTSLGRTACK